MNENVTDNTKVGAKPKKKLGAGNIILIAMGGVLLAMIIAIAVFLIVKPTFINGIVSNAMLVKLVKDKEIECTVDADITYGTFNAETEALFWRTELEDEQMATMVEIGKMRVYYISGYLYLENGRGFTLGGKKDSSGYSDALNALPDLLEGYTVYSEKTSSGRKYSVTVTGQGAIDFVEQLYPDYADKISDVDDIKISLVSSDWKITSIEVEGSATLEGGKEAELDARIEIIPESERSEHEIPQAVLDNIGEDIEKLEVSQDMIDIAYAISRFYSKDPNAADISIATDLAIITLDYDNLGWYRCKIDDQWINYVRVASKNHYYNGNGSCNADGSSLNEAEKSSVDIAMIVDAVYDIFLERKFSATEKDGQTLYQIDLDKDDITNLVTTFLPKYVDYISKIETATASVTTVEGQVTEVSLVLNGSVSVLFFNKDFFVSLTFTPVEDVDSVEFDIPDAVIEALID